MWLWECELHEIGFRRRSRRYWQLCGGPGLPGGAYVSAFGSECHPDVSGRRLVELAAFHVTFPTGADNLHFYYHEVGENVWEPGEHTSSAEIRRHGVDPARLRQYSDVAASELVAALNGVFVPRLPG